MRKIFKKFSVTFYLHNTFSFEDGFYQIVLLPSLLFLVNKSGFRGTNTVFGITFLAWDAGVIIHKYDK